MYSDVKQWLHETVGFGLRAENIPPEAIKYVEEAWRLGAAAEREECAKIVDGFVFYADNFTARSAAASIQTLIRARSKVDGDSQII